MNVKCPYCGSTEVYLVAGAEKYVCKRCHNDFPVKEAKKL